MEFRCNRRGSRLIKMVSMSLQNSRLLELLISNLKDKATSIDVASVEFAFSSWLNSNRSDEVSSSANRALALSGASRSYREVAILGYAGDLGLLDDDSLVSLKDGLQWLSGRSAFQPNSVPNFEIHGVALLGLALGVRTLSEPLKSVCTSWFDSFLQKSSTSNINEFNYSMIALASYILDCRNKIIFKDDVYSTSAQYLYESKIKGHKEPGALTKVVENIDINYIDGENVECALKLHVLEEALRGISNVDFNAIKLSNVIGVLNNLPHALKRWTWEDTNRTGREGGEAIKWKIENEYHFQNLLWTVLAPVFPELEDEENLKSVGPKRPRGDLCIPSLGLVIEVKYMRSSTQAGQAKLIDELAADVTLYCSTGSGYTRIIPVIWDDTRSIEVHSELINTLEKMPKIAKAFIFSRPGRMITT